MCIVHRGRDGSKMHCGKKVLQGIYVIADNILVTREGETKEKPNQDYDDKLRALLNKCREKNIKLNAKKVSI